VITIDIKKQIEKIFVVLFELKEEEIKGGLSNIAIKAQNLAREALLLQRLIKTPEKRTQKLYSKTRGKINAEGGKQCQVK